MTSVKKSMMSAPSPVFSRTMSAIVGGFRSVVVSVVCVLADMCSSMGEGWGFVKRENSHYRGHREHREKGDCLNQDLGN